jgi:hypothetical protein
MRKSLIYTCRALAVALALVAGGAEAAKLSCASRLYGWHLVAAVKLGGAIMVLLMIAGRLADSWVLRTLPLLLLLLLLRTLLVPSCCVAAATGWQCHLPVTH